MSIFPLSFVSRAGLSCRIATAFAAVVLTVFPALGQDKPLPAAKLFPADTQALFSLPHSEAFLAAWNETQLGKLAEDAQLKDFWTTQRKEIQDRFSEAGWQLNLEIEDIKELSGGQTSLGWISRPAEANKPFSIAMIIDVVNRSVPAESFLKRVDTELKVKNAVANTITVSGAKVFQYTLPKVAGDTRAHEAFYSLSKDQLLATDDLLTMNELLASQGGTKKDSLADSELYTRVQAKVPNGGDQPEIEYFVRPIGFAKLLRSISGKPIKNQADILLILDREGFGDLECLAGNLQISTDTFDFFPSWLFDCKATARKSGANSRLPQLAKIGNARVDQQRDSFGVILFLEHQGCVPKVQDHCRCFGRTRNIRRDDRGDSRRSTRSTDRYFQGSSPVFIHGTLRCNGNRQADYARTASNQWSCSN